MAWEASPSLNLAAAERVVSPLRSEAEAGLLAKVHASAWLSQELP